MDTNYYTYYHKRLDTSQIFYVGKGKDNRISSTQGRNRYWHNIVNKHGYSQHILRDNLTEEQAYSFETEFIKLCREAGYPIVNLTDGGEGRSPSLETRLKQSIAMKGRKNRLGTKTSEVTKMKQRTARLGKKMSPESRKRCSVAKRGRSRTTPVTATTRKKLSDATTAYWNRRHQEISL